MVASLMALNWRIPARDSVAVALRCSLLGVKRRSRVPISMIVNQRTTLRWGHSCPWDNQPEEPGYHTGPATSSQNHDHMLIAPGKPWDRRPEGSESDVSESSSIAMLFQSLAALCCTPRPYSIRGASSQKLEKKPPDCKDSLGKARHGQCPG